MAYWLTYCDTIDVLVVAEDFAGPRGTPRLLYYDGESFELVTTMDIEWWKEPDINDPELLTYTTATYVQCTGDYLQIIVRQKWPPRGGNPYLVSYQKGQRVSQYTTILIFSLLPFLSLSISEMCKLRQYLL